MNPPTTQLSNLIRSSIVLLSTAFLAGPSQTYAQAVDDAVSLCVNIRDNQRLGLITASTCVNHTLQIVQFPMELSQGVRGWIIAGLDDRTFLLPVLGSPTRDS